MQTDTLTLKIEAGPALDAIACYQLLARAIDAMCRTEPNGVSTAEWDAIVAEGTELLRKAVVG